MLSEGYTQTHIDTDMITLRLIFLRSKNRLRGHKEFSLHPYKVFREKLTKHTVILFELLQQKTKWSVESGLIQGNLINTEKTN
jgi:hypothetical protein